MYLIHGKYVRVKHSHEMRPCCSDLKIVIKKFCHEFIPNSKCYEMVNENFKENKGRFELYLCVSSSLTHYFISHFIKIIMHN